MRVVACLCTFACCTAAVACGGSGSTSSSGADDTAADGGRPAICSNPAVQYLNRPMYPDERDSPSFGLAYEKMQQGSADKPTVIYVPGGPGNPGIDGVVGCKEPNCQAMHAPDQTIYFYDPRGTECSAPSNVEDKFFYTKSAASDLVALVQSLGLTNYVLFGESYGTYVTTLAAYELQKAGNPPAKVILSGTLGRTFDLFSDGYAAHWQNAKAQLPESVRKMLSADTLPFGLSPIQWGRFIALKLHDVGIMGGDLYGPGLVPQLLPLQSTDPAAKATLRDAVSQIPTLLAPIPDFAHDATTQMVRVVSCTELGYPDVEEFTNPELIGGELVFIGDQGLCDGYPRTLPYDAKNYMLTSPIVYLEGKDDSQTPSWQSQYHYDAQTEALRVKIDVPNEVHLPIHQQFGISCGDQVMKAIHETPVAGLNDAVRAAVAQCSVPATVMTASAK